LQATYKGHGSEVKLHAKKKYGLKYEEITLKNISTSKQHKISISSITYDKENDIFFIPAIGLNTEDKFELLIDYTGFASEENGYYIWQTLSKRVGVPTVVAMLKSNYVEGFHK
jgi:hypothetical protein